MKNGFIGIILIVSVLFSWAGIAFSAPQSGEKIVLVVDGHSYTKANITALESLHKSIDKMSGNFPKQEFDIKKANIKRPTTEYIRKLESIKKMIVIYSANENRLISIQNSPLQSPKTELTVTMAQFDKVNSELLTKKNSITDLNKQIEYLKNENKELKNKIAKKTKEPPKQNHANLNNIVIAFTIVFIVMILYIVYLLNSKHEIENKLQCPVKHDESIKFIAHSNEELEYEESELIKEYKKRIENLIDDNIRLNTVGTEHDIDLEKLREKIEKLTKDLLEKETETTQKDEKINILSRELQHIKKIESLDKILDSNETGETKHKKILPLPKSSLEMDEKLRN